MCLLSGILFVHSLIAAVSQSKPDWALNKKKRGSKSLKMPAWYAHIFPMSMILFLQIFISSFSPNAYVRVTANISCKSNVILWLYFGNLVSYFLLMLMVHNLNYVRNSDVAITLAQLT